VTVTGHGLLGVADAGAFLARLTRLDPGAPVRLRAAGERTALWGHLPWDVLVTREVAGAGPPGSAVSGAGSPGGAGPLGAGPLGAGSSGGAGPPGAAVSGVGPAGGAAASTVPGAGSSGGAGAVGSTVSSPSSATVSGAGAGAADAALSGGGPAGAVVSGAGAADARVAGAGPADATVSAAELLAVLSMGGDALPTVRDHQWRWPLPPPRPKWVETVSTAELSRLARAAAGTLREVTAGGLGGRAVGQRAVRDALLDHVAMVVTPAGGGQVEVSQRLIQAVFRMGFLGPADVDGPDTRVYVAGRWVGLSAPYGVAWRQSGEKLAVFPISTRPNG
jgi:hypothetical protein